MSTGVLLGLVLVSSLTLYALLGGADYGGGVWDLLATGPSADRQRATIAQAIGPVWEANHVWLILAIVLLFSGFPRAFAIISTYLHIPLLLVLVGVVLRGSAFVFRAYGFEDPQSQRFWGRVFAISSTVTPLFLGVIVGAVTEGKFPGGTTPSFAATFVRPWLTPFSIAVGVFALLLFTFLAAVYLTLEARDADVRAAFRRRALWAGIGVFVVAAIVLMIAAPAIRVGLLTATWAIPLHIATGASALLAFASLWRGQFRMARLAAAVQVTCILWGWALTQYPFVVRPSMTLADAAAPPNVQVVLLEACAVGIVLLAPSLFYLFRIFGPRGRSA